MKKLFCFLIVTFSLTVSAQNDTISVSREMKSVVSADKINVVYRGISNPLSIAVNGAKSYTASAPGLKYTEGKYYLTPGFGNEVIVALNIILNDNSEITEEHKFRIKSLNSPMAFINSTNCDNCIVEMTKEELQTAEISLKIVDFAIHLNLQIESFQVNFSNKKTIDVAGNKLNYEALKEISKLKKGTIFLVDRIRIYNPTEACLPGIKPIKIMIVE